MFKVKTKNKIAYYEITGIEIWFMDNDFLRFTNDSDEYIIIPKSQIESIETYIKNA